MSNLSIFNFENKPINALSINDEPWFFAKDICNALNIHITQTRKLDEEELSLYSIQTSVGKRDVSIVSEAGMYTLVLRCRDAVKKGTVPHRFRKWVTSEVLPSIRKTGSYTHTINAEQQYLIKEAVNTLSFNSGKSHQSIYSSLYRAFKIPRYQDLPASKFDDAIMVLSTGEHKVESQISEADLLNIRFLCFTMNMVSGWWYQYGSTIRKLNSNMGASLHDYFKDGGAVASSFSKRLGLNIQSWDYVTNFPFHGGAQDKQDYYVLKNGEQFRERIKQDEFVSVPFLGTAT